jgi:hypothetical protein
MMVPSYYYSASMAMAQFCLFVVCRGGKLIDHGCGKICPRLYSYSVHHSG